jgi:DNA polymerase III delta prime subunit
MNYNENECLWVEKYRPKTVDDCILPERIKEKFRQFLKDDYIPNLLLSGTAGVGKTSVAKAVLDEGGFDWIIINGSMDSGIDTLRVKIKQFASTMSLTGKRKYVILDEADYLNGQSTQPALRNFMEEYSNNCGFIMTCNYKDRIIKELHSRCSQVHFSLVNGEKAEMAKQFMSRVGEILTIEKVKCNKTVLANIIKNYFPDFRKVINECQIAAANGAGEITSETLVTLDDENYKRLIGILSDKDFKEMRKWIGHNSDIDSVVLYRRLYDTAYDVCDKKSIPQLVLVIGKYMYQDAFVADKEINTASCMTELMMECDFKV